ncbi:MAG: SPOR domain-containing protein [Candidatus Thorarchaeota archaeon]
MSTNGIKYCAFVIAILLFLPFGESSASDRFYSVQAGTYSLSKIKFAGKQFDFLAKNLKEEDRAYLRIEEGTKYYIVRTGRIKDGSEAIALRERVKEFVPDAIIVTQKNFRDIKIVRLYKKKEPKSEPVLTEYYTLQIGNFVTQEPAKEKFESLKKTLMEKQLKYLRIEKIGTDYSVRLGKFENFSRARDFQKSIGEAVADAIILKAFIKDEQLIEAYGYDAEDTMVITKSKEASQDEFSENNKEVYTTSVNPEPVDNLITEISSYYDNDDYGKAAELLRKGLARWPDNPDLHAWYGATLLNMEFPEKAYEEYQKAVELSPDVPDFHAGIGYSLLDIYMDKARNSIAAFRKALEIDPDNVSALEGLGIVYVSIDQKDLATDVYNQLKDIDGEAADRLYQIIDSGLQWDE